MFLSRSNGFTDAATMPRVRTSDEKYYQLWVYYMFIKAPGTFICKGYPRQFYCWIIILRPVSKNLAGIIFMLGLNLDLAGPTLFAYTHAVSQLWKVLET